MRLLADVCLIESEILAPPIVSTFDALVLFPDPALKEGKGLVYIERSLGYTGCSVSCDCHDNASTALKHSNSGL